MSDDLISNLKEMLGTTDELSSSSSERYRRPPPHCLSSCLSVSKLARARVCAATRRTALVRTMICSHSSLR